MLPPVDEVAWVTDPGAATTPSYPVPVPRPYSMARSSPIRWDHSSAVCDRARRSSNPRPWNCATQSTESLNPSSTYPTDQSEPVYEIFEGRARVRFPVGPHVVVCVRDEKNGDAFAAPPGIPALLNESMRLNLRALPCPFSRGIEFLSGVCRGTRTLAGASRSYGVRPVPPTGFDGVQSFASSLVKYWRCAARSLPNAATWSAVSDFSSASSRAICWRRPAGDAAPFCSGWPLPAHDTSPASCSAYTPTNAAL
jgi:hypothetical protein